jgi:Tol biopolymer transport system component
VVAPEVGRLLELRDQALALEKSARVAFLDSACEGDAEMRAAVSALLAQETRTRTFPEAPASRPDRDRVLPGALLGPYEIVSLIGAGAMGEVYRARDTRLGRAVAIKVLPAALAADPVRRARFGHEARAASALNHPHICTLYDVGSEGGLDYLVMEHLEGETLAARLTHGPVPTREALAFASQVADALASAHASGLVHRDLKPANVMLTAGGAKLLDFGIAKVDAGAARPAPDETSLTADGQIVGTIAYMAPEQLRGGPADARSDIFSLGAVLYEMFAGRRAFPGESQSSVIAAILERDPPPISTLHPGTPPAVDDLVRRCLAKDPRARWQCASDLGDGLRGVVDASPPAAMPRARPGRSRVARATAIGGAIAAAVGIGVTARYLLSRGERTASAREAGPAAGRTAAGEGAFARAADVVLAAVTHEAGVESFPSLAPDGREFVYATGPLDFFGESDIHRRDVGFDRPFNLTPDSPGTDTQPAFSPDGNLIAFRSDRGGGGIFVMRRDGTAMRRLTEAGYNPAWSPAGTEVAYATVHTMASPFVNGGVRSELWAVNVETGARRQIRPKGAAQPSWSPHGHRIAYWSGGSISTCRPDGSEATAVVSGPRRNWNPVWSPDGAYLYFVSDRNGPMHLWRVRMDERSGRPLDGPEPTPIPMPSAFVAHPTLDATGRRLLFASVPQTASIQRVEFDVTTGVVHGGLTPLTTGTLVSVYPEPSPDGTRVAFQTFGDREDIYASGADGSNPRLVVGGGGVYRQARWSPDGRRIAFYSSRGASASVWVVDADGGNLREVTRSRAAPVIHPAWSPDGRMAASEVSPGTRSFTFDPDQPWDEARNLTVLPRPDPETQFIPWSWSPTGDRLAGFGRRDRDPASTLPGVLVLTIGTGHFDRVTSDGRQPGPVWLPDGQRIVYAVSNRLMLLDLRTRRSRELLNVGAGRIEPAAGGGFGVSAAAGRIYVAPVTRDGDIWLAEPR